MSGPRLALEVVDNPPPNDAERRLARDIAWALGWTGSIADDPTNLAGMLALVREGYTLEGPRKLVSGTATLPVGRLNPLEVARATEYVWRSWAGELARGGLRPCGWPTLQRVYVMSPQLVAGETTWVELDDDDERAEYLILSVTCEAVPA